ncbi:hypothetical protein JST97_17685 [bacterium]|nr:hypothetical protein [bacterium]
MRIWLVWLVLSGLVWAGGRVLLQVGSPTGEAGLVDGVGDQARLAKPIRLSALNAHSVLVADINNHALRQVDEDGRVSTLVGEGLKAPHGVAVAADGRIAVADAESNQVFLLDAQSHRLSLFAGEGTPGSNDGPNAEARFSAPHSICWGPGGELFVADIGNGSVRVIDQGRTRTLVHQGLKWPMDLAVDAEGQLWIADAGSQTIFKWTHQSGLSKPFPDLLLQMPHGLCLGPDGSVYVAEMRANRISRIDPDGQLSTVWDQGLLKPAALLWDSGGLWVADLGHHRVLRLSIPSR